MSTMPPEIGSPGFRPLSEEDALAAAQDALSAAERRCIRLSRTERIGDEQRRNLILRASVADGRRPARSVIVKATRARSYDATAEDVYATSGFAKELAALSLLRVRAGMAALAPPLLAADAPRGVLVVDDAGAGLPSLVEPLLRGSAEAAEAALLAYATALARLHAATLGCRDEHAAIVQQVFPSALVPTPGGTWIDRVAQKAATLLGGTLPAAEMASVADRLRAPGSWLALAHRDPCPDNVLLAEDGTARLVDFEFAAPGHALLDAAYWRVGFPTCWCAGTVPTAVADRLDAAYRSALAPMVPEAADDTAFQREAAVIAAIWLFDSLSWQLEPALADNTRWGIASRRGRILRFMAVVTEATQGSGILPELGELVGRWHEQLRSRWGDTAALAPYPAFTT